MRGSQLGPTGLEQSGTWNQAVQHGRLSDSCKDALSVNVPSCIRPSPAQLCLGQLGSRRPDKGLSEMGPPCPAVRTEKEPCVRCFSELPQRDFLHPLSNNKTISAYSAFGASL